MKVDVTNSLTTGKSLITKCHVCGHIMESETEIKKCSKCKKSFMPLNYFTKIHAKNSKEFSKLFVKSNELKEEDLITGIQVLW